MLLTLDIHLAVLDMAITCLLKGLVSLVVQCLLLFFLKLFFIDFVKVLDVLEQGCLSCDFLLFGSIRVVKYFNGTFDLLKMELNDLIIVPLLEDLYYLLKFFPLLLSQILIETLTKFQAIYHPLLPSFTFAIIFIRVATFILHLLITFLELFLIHSSPDVFLLFVGRRVVLVLKMIVTSLAISLMVDLIQFLYLLIVFLLKSETIKLVL